MNTLEMIDQLVDVECNRVYAQASLLRRILTAIAATKAAVAQRLVNGGNTVPQDLAPLVRRAIEEMAILVRAEKFAQRGGLTSLTSFEAMNRILQGNWFEADMEMTAWVPGGGITTFFRRGGKWTESLSITLNSEGELDYVWDSLD